MNKKFLSAILFGALMVTSTGTFVSCKDYDDDIDAINKELTDVKSQIAALQAKVDAGKWITSVSSNAAGVTINLSDGSSVNVTNGKDGAQGEAGKDGKDGSVVEVKDGVLYINGEATEIKVAEEAPAALPCVKVENGELMILGENNEYVASGIKTCSVVAVKENGVWTITTADGESIIVPGSAALTSIAIQGLTNNALVYNYGYFAADKKWGWNEEEKAEAGFYSRLSKDVEVLLNPAEADGTAFTYTFRNSVKAIEGLTFFGEARPSTAVLTRAASGNGVWTLPAAVTKHDATSISELRNELYLNFKQNDSKYYAMSLEAVDGLGNVATRSDYEYKITLDQTNVTPTVANMNCLVAQEYYPVVNGPVIDYKIRVYPTVANKRKADAFGIELTADEKGFIANNESAVYNEVQFQVAYVTINGDAGKTSFVASFKDEFTDSEEVRVEEKTVPFDAVLSLNAKKNAPADEIVGRFGTQDKKKAFVLKLTYDLKSIEGLSDEAKMVLEEGFNTNNTTAELIGGESIGDENYNELDRNGQLLKNIKWSYDKKTQTVEVRLYVSAHWPQPKKADDPVHGIGVIADAEWDAYSNFQLNTAYQLNLTVKDTEFRDIEIAKFELPFELTEPTSEIEKVPGEFSEWGTVFRGYDEDGYEIWKPALYVYGYYNSGMRLPLYDSFSAWKAKDVANGIKKDYQVYKDNAEYYTLYIQELGKGNKVNVLGETELYTPLALDNKLDYSSYFTNYLTYAGTTAIKGAAAESDKYNDQKELMSGVEVSYKHYGVYLAEKTTEYDENGNVVYPYNKVIDNDDFYLVYASWIKHSDLEMADDEYVAERGSHVVYITNDDLNFTTPKGDNFYLFNDVNGTQLVDRSTINASFNEVTEHPFTTVEELFTASNKLITAKPANGDDEVIEVEYVNENTALTADYFNVDLNDGEVTLNLNMFKAKKDIIQVYNVRSIVQQSKKEVATGIQQEFQGGMAIVLPSNWADYDTAVVTLTIKDKWGYENSVDINVTKLDK